MEYATTAQPLLRTYCFADRLFRSTPRALEHHGETVDLPPQALQILDQLLIHVGEVVTRESLKEEVFADRPFLDHRQAINLAISQLRRALGDDARSPRFIETVGSSGYRFIYPVEVESTPLTLPVSRPRVASSFAAAPAAPPAAKLVAACLLVLVMASSPVARVGGSGGDSERRLHIAPWSCSGAACPQLEQTLTNELAARAFAAASPRWTVQALAARGTAEPSTARIVDAGLRTISPGRRVVTLRLTTGDGVLLWASTGKMSDAELGPWLDHALAEMLADPLN